MSINHGAGGGGVGSATEPGPTVNVGDADSGLYANNNPTSQAGNDALSFERVRKMVQGAVDNIKFEARYGSPLSDAPGVEEFRRQYYALMCQVRDGEYRAYIKKKLKVAWAWAGDHQPRRLRDQRGYSLILRDKIFEDGELRADQHHAAMNAAPSAVVEIEPPAASSATMEQPPPEPAGEERAPALQRNVVGHTVTPEDRLVGLIIRHRVPAADVPVAPEYFYDADLRYLWMRWQRLGGDVDQVDMDAIRARIGHAWSVFTVWLIDVAAAPDQDNPIGPIREIATLAEQIRGHTTEEPPPLPPAAPLEIEAPPESLAPAAAAEIEAQASLPLDRADPAEIAARNLAAALDLAGAGIPVFPVRLTWNSKKQKWDKPPAIDGWQNAGTIDPEQIRAWWHDLPGALGVPSHYLVPGIWCAHPDLRFVVIDADRHPGGADGVAAFQALVDQNWLPIGPVTKTANGGDHYIFRQPAGEPFGDTKGSLPDGVDVRGSGLIVGPGAMRPDGAMWRGWPSLVEAFPKGLVPELPDWIAALIRTPKPVKEKAPKEEKAVEPAAVLSDIAPASGKRKASPEIYAKWSAAALTGNADKLAAARPGTRNNLANILAYRMGRMVAPGWIKESTVIDAFMLASESNGKILDDGGPASIRATIESGLAAGKRKPLSDLPDRPSRPWQPIDDDDDNMWVRSLRSEMRALYRVRFPNNPGAVDAADERLMEIIKFTADPWVIGRELRLTFDEYQRLAKEPHGRRRGARLPGKMKPCDVTREEVDAYRNARKRAADKDRKSKKRAADKAELAAIDDLDDRASVVLTFLCRAKTPRTTAQIMKGVKRSRAFMKLSRKSLRNAVLRLLEPASPLYGLVTQTVGVAKNGKPTKLVAARREGNPATTTEAEP